MLKRRYVRHRPLFTSPVPKSVSKPKIRWRILPIFWLAFKRMCFVIGFIVFMSALSGVYLASLIQTPAAPPLPQKMALYLEFNGDVYETPQPPSFLGAFGAPPMTARDIVDAIDRAAADPRVQGMLARINDGGFSFSHVQEIRGAVKRFRDAGKFAYIYAPSYGEGGGGLGSYYLASAFEQIWMQPMGVVSVAGIRAEVPYFRAALDKLGIAPQFFQRKEYKTAYESATNTEMSPENKRMLEDIIASLRSKILTDIPAARGMQPSDFERIINTGLFPAQEALKAGLVTHVDYVDVLVENISETVTGDRARHEEAFVTLPEYQAASLHAEAERRMLGFGKGKPRVALVYISGAIMDSRTAASAPGFVDEGIAAADEIAPAILDAADDETVKAILLRVDSPGGSPLASETILRAVDRAKAKGKTVIVSMGDAAASGGYWVSAYADRIFAMPTTLTGSIGVLGGKVSAQDTWTKLGVAWNTDVQWGANAGLWSINTPFSESEAARINAMLDQVYDGFLARVAKGRKMTVEQVDRIARGRVWTGAQAVTLGLVDEAGGLREALEYTAKKLGAADRSGVDIVILPRPKTAFEQLAELLGQYSAVYEIMRFQGALSKALGPFLEQAAVMGENPAAVYEPLKIAP